MKSLRLVSVRLPLGLLSALILILCYIPHRDFLRAQSPYEGWDEVFLYNKAGSLMHHQVKGEYYAVYGMLDTAKYVLARWLCERETGSPRPVYSNNVEKCWQNPSYDAAQDFGYARGIEDRKAVLLAREINLAFVYLITAFTLACAICIYGKYSLGVISCLSLLLTSHFCFEQSSYAIPNGPNAILTFAVLLFSVTAVLRNRPCWLALAAVLLALGINHKFDFLVVGVIPASAFMYFVIRDFRNPAKLLKSLALLASIFAGTLFLTSPISFLVELQHQVWQATQLTNGSPDVAGNFTKALTVVSLDFSLDPTSWQPVLWIVAIFFPLFLLTALTGPLGATYLHWTQRAVTFCTITFGISLCVAIPVLRANTFYGRYLINGVAALHAGAALGMVMLSSRSPLRAIRDAAWILTFVSVGFLGLRVYKVEQRHSGFFARFDPVTRMDNGHSRSRAVSDAVARIKEGAFPGSVLVDQHAYIDLRCLREMGIEPILINFLNYRQQIDRLPLGNHLVIFATGEYTSQQPWEGVWPEPIRARYDAYLEFLKSQPVVADYPGTKMQLLGWRPPVAGDWITLSRIQRLR